MSKYAFNKANMARFTAERTHAEGAFARIITDAEPHDSDNNDHIMLVITSKALSDPDDPSSVVPHTDLKTWVTLPLDNPDVDGHEAPEYAGRMWASFCAAVFSDECSALPGRIEYDAEKQKMTGPLYFDGEPIEDGDYKACEAAAIESCGEKAAEIAEDYTQLVGRGYYCHVKHKPDDNGKPRPNQVAFRAELPDHWELASEFVITTAAGNGNGAAATKKAGGKKTAKSSAGARKASKQKSGSRRRRT